MYDKMSNVAYNVPITINSVDCKYIKAFRRNKKANALNLCILIQKIQKENKFTELKSFCLLSAFVNLQCVHYHSNAQGKIHPVHSRLGENIHCSTITYLYA